MEKQKKEKDMIFFKIILNVEKSNHASIIFIVHTLRFLNNDHR
jgi:hypothetical protein